MPILVNNADSFLYLQVNITDFGNSFTEIVHSRIQGTSPNDLIFAIFFYDSLQLYTLHSPCSFSSLFSFEKFFN